MSAATTIANAFGENANLYTEVLALSESGPQVAHAHIRRAYYKRALLYHPDKQDPAKLSTQQIEDAKAKFQAVSVAYSILSNEESRAEYDETGELYEEDDDDMGGKSGTDQWTEYFSGIFGKVTVDDIDKFESQYKCSDEEERDVLKYYARFKGDLNKCLECVMCSREEDKRRWVDDYINPAVERKEVEDYREEINRTVGGGGSVSAETKDEEMSVDDEEDEDDNEATETESDTDEEKKKISPKKKGAKAKKQQAKKDKGKKPAAKKGSKAKAIKKTGGGGGGPDADLIAAIRGNAVARSQRSFDSMMAGLEERYGGDKKKKKGEGTKKRKKEADPGDIPDDEFERIRASLGKK